MASPARKHKVFWAIGLFLALAIVASVPGVAQSEIEELQSDSQQLDKELKPIQQFRDEGGVGIGCFNRVRLPDVTSSLINDPKMKALQNFTEANIELAHSMEQNVTAQEHLLNLKWWKTPRLSRILPWYKGRYSKLQAGINTRILWAKSELSDHSCSKR